ncbi:HSP90 family protein [Tissierella praeacuta]|uniref:ATP-binding protein n=1 Tax=Tissierella praeacuta TaxID=43131 RepID=UPI000DFF2220|nr:ATP-binding protein [Tissierella praeacuta]SUP02525.1 HSP90 family protein [Tissierella praeacuta]
MVNVNSEFAAVEDIIKLAASVKSPLVSIAELVKNGADAGAKEVIVDISKEQMKISVKDNGKGFSDNDIQYLHRIYYSNKKRNGNLTNDHNEFFAGSKGLGLFSAFFLGDEIEIITENSNFSYSVKWFRDAIPIIEEISTTGETGTKITIHKLNKKRLNHLLKEKEMKKFQFVSLGLYNSKSNLPEIKLLIDGQEVENLSEIKNVVNHKIKVNFSYDKTTRKLNFQYVAFKEEVDPEREKKRKKINGENLILDLTKSNETIYDCIQEHYRFDYSNRGAKKLNYQIDEEINQIIDSWPSFEGEYWIEEGPKADKVKEFGFGVKLYVNKYALYDYLNSEFDWLGLSNISDNYVSSAFKLRNVLGYVNFVDFDENTEEIEISDERGGFLESTALENIMLGIRNFITYLAININVVMRSSNFTEQENTSGGPEEGSEEGASGGPEEGSKEGTSGGSEEGSEEGISDGSEEGSEEGTSGGSEEGSEEGTSGGSEEGTEEGILGDQGENSEEKILKQKQKTLKYGQTWNIYDSKVVHDGVTPKNTLYTVSKACNINNHIFEADEPGKFVISYFRALERSRKEELSIIVAKRKKVHKKKGEIFNDTDVVVGDLYLDELHSIAMEVANIDYKCYPLLSAISLRVVLEDLVKKECRYTGLMLTGNLAENFENVMDSFIDRIEIRRNDPKKTDIEELHKEFRGRDALKNLLNHWKDNAKSTSNTFNYVTHNPVPILNVEEIYNFANNILVPFGHLISSAKEKGI